MPTHIRAMCQWQIGSALPRDVMQITPTFRHQQVLPVDGGPEWDDLADDLADGLDSWGGATQQITVKLYQIGLPKPNRPKATSVRRAGTIPAGNVPRELAVCLSFNGGQNAPRQRGRLYIPAQLAGGVPSQMQVRVPTESRDKVALLPALFAGLGGIDVDWIVWSPTNSSATKVERWFVDDEWDVIRKRGLQPINRNVGTTGG
jgi:hypothetical protein